MSQKGCNAYPAAIQYGEPRRPSKARAPKTITCANSTSIQIGCVSTTSLPRVANPKYAPAATNKKMTSTERPMMSLVKRDSKNAGIITAIVAKMAPFISTGKIRLGLERVMNLIRNGLGMRKGGDRRGASQPENPHSNTVFTQVHNTL